MRTKILLGFLFLLGAAFTVQAEPPGGRGRVVAATGLPLGAFAREEALTVIPVSPTILRVAPVQASSIDPTLATRLPFTRGRTRPMFSDPDSTIRPAGVAAPRIYQPAIGPFVTVAR